MAFDPEELDPTIDFTAVPENTVKWVEGRGQWVYWKGCNVTVYEKDSEGNEQARKLVGIPDGQGMVPSGTQLYCFRGKVKET